MTSQKPKVQAVRKGSPGPTAPEKAEGGTLHTFSRGPSELTTESHSLWARRARAGGVSPPEVTAGEGTGGNALFAINVYEHLLEGAQTEPDSPDLPAWTAQCQQ